MKKILVATLLVCMILLPTIVLANEPQKIQETPHGLETQDRLFQVSFLTYFGGTLNFTAPLGTNWNDSPFTINKISLNILGGYSYGNTILEIGGLYNVNTHMTKGLQIAGLMNQGGEAYHTFQIAGLSNSTEEGTVVAQIGGLFANISGGLVQGVQLGGGLINFADGVQGLQIGGGIVNLSSGAVQGIQIGGALVSFADGVQGIQIGGGLVNFAGRVHGIQIGGGFLNFADGVQGIQIGGGLVNFAGDVQGIQIGGGIVNFAEDMQGIQIGGGIVNFSRDVQGIQIGGGIVNFTEKLQGIQIGGGIVNFAEDVQGIQIGGGLVNFADTLQGVQIGGLVNFAGKLQGVQIGLINYAVESDGISIGLINIIERGGRQDYELSFSEVLTTAISFKSGKDNFYTVLSGGIKYLSTSSIEYAWGLGIGTHIDWVQGWGNQIELLSYTVTENGTYPIDFINNLYQLKLTVSKEVGRNFEVFAGPVLNLSVSNYENPQTGELGSSLAPWSMWKTNVGGTILDFWAGVSLGMRVN